MTALGPRELLKYEWRTKLFLKKYENNEPFDLVKGNTVSLIFSSDVAKIIENGDQKKLARNILKTTDGNLIKLSDLEKTGEFGGKGENSGVKIELKEIENLNYQINNIKMTTGNPTVPIWFNKIHNTVSIEKTSGTPKSDFHLVDVASQSSVWISHKKGNKPTDFQQWSGMLEKGIVEEEEVQNFAKEVAKVFPNGIDNKTTVARKINSHLLKLKSIYGVDYGKSHGPQNVSLVVQGNMKLVPNNEHWDIVGNHVHSNGQYIENGYEPVLMAIFKGDRNNFGVKGARFCIQPIASRKINKFI